MSGMRSKTTSSQTLRLTSHLTTTMCPNSLGEVLVKPCVWGGWRYRSEREGRDDFFWWSMISKNCSDLEVGVMKKIFEKKLSTYDFKFTKKNCSKSFSLHARPCHTIFHHVFFLSQRHV